MQTTEHLYVVTDPEILGGSRSSRGRVRPSVRSSSCLDHSVSYLEFSVP